MLRDFIQDNETKAISHDVEMVRELLQAKAELEARVVQDIVNFEDRYGVVIDRVRFQRLVTRSPKTIYTELTVLLE